MESTPAPTPDPNISANNVDHYVSHLSSVSEKNEVTTTEDIFNDRGILLVKKGSLVNQNAAQRLIKHRLTKPLEAQVQIKSSLNRETLQETFHQMFAKLPDVKQAHINLNVQQDFDLLLHHWDFHPIISQKLTVLREQMVAEYEKGLFSAWLSFLIAREMGLDQGQVMAAFTSGLVHDIGLMHIDPAVVTKRGELNATEWRAIQSHTVIGKVVLDSLTTLDPRVSLAVLQHHERCDGLGYPAGKSESELERIGQIVGMADSVQAIRVNQFQKLGRNLRDLQAYLQMNADVHLREVYEALSAIIRKTQLPPTIINPYGDVRSLVAQIRPQWAALKKVAGFVDTLLSLVDAIDFSGKNKRLQRVFTRLQVLLTQSGLVHETLGDWLAQAAEKPDAETLKELVEIELMLNELGWQLKNVRLALQQLLDDPKIPDDAQILILRKMCEEMSTALEAAKHAGRPTTPNSPAP